VIHPGRSEALGLSLFGEAKPEEFEQEPTECTEGSLESRYHDSYAPIPDAIEEGPLCTHRQTSVFSL
jgi:hypothetical protein